MIKSWWSKKRGRRRERGRRRWRAALRPTAWTSRTLPSVSSVLIRSTPWNSPEHEAWLLYPRPGGLISYLCEKVGMYCMCLYCNDRGKNFSSVESIQQHMVDKCHCRIFFEEDTGRNTRNFDYSKSYPPTCPPKMVNLPKKRLENSRSRNRRLKSTMIWNWCCPLDLKWVTGPRGSITSSTFQRRSRESLLW